MAEQSTVQSLDRAFDLLETLCRSRNGMSIGGLSAETGLHKSTVHRLLASMCARGYVQRDAETSVYRAGMRLCEMSSYIVDNLDIVERARASLERLEQCTDETVHLVMRDDKDIVYIHKVDNGSSAIRMFSRIGMRLPLYCTGVGKAILATWDTAEVRDVWQHSDVHAWTEHTIVDEDAFFREIDKVRQLGYALDNEENELGVRCIAAAIPDYRGRASYAISLSAPVSRMTTAGKGRDTALLCRLTGENGRVLAFDVQEDAVRQTRELLAKEHLSAEVYLDSHANMAHYAEPETVDCIVFNFGRLPGGDPTKFTTAETSLPAVDAGLKLLKKGGLMALALYYGKENGYEERDAILAHLRELDDRTYTVLGCEWMNRKNDPPLPIFIWKE